MVRTLRSIILVVLAAVMATTAEAAPAQQVGSKAAASKAAQRSARLARVAAAQAARRARELNGVPDDGSRQLDRELRRRANQDPSGRSRVIVELKPGFETASTEAKALGAKLGRRLRSFNGQVVELSNAQLKRLAKSPAVASIHYDRPAFKHNNRTAVTIGARTAQLAYGLSGAGVGVAVIDSGITSWHDDLTGSGVYPYGNQRVSAFVDFVNGRALPYDDNGHGTHVAGTIAGNGYDSYGYKAGMAPGAHLVVLKVLDAHGVGTVSNMIAALDYVVAHKSDLNIRVVNMSIGASISESYETDPLTLAAKRAVDAGVVVVAAAGNLGRNAAGQTVYGSITSPGNAPWVLTVGASSTHGTVNRTDDTIAGYSSRGPTNIDYIAKPDLVAPGTGTVSLSDPSSTFFTTKAASLLPGYLNTAYLPYLSLSGTSMASPAVAGVVALMVEANPTLTPNLVKAILEYTAQQYPGYDALTEGSGFLNAMGAIEMARFFATAQPGDAYPTDPYWSNHLIWGNHRVGGGLIAPSANAWNNSVWGSAFDEIGDNVVWGSDCGILCDNVVWGSNGDDNVVWGSSGDDNVVWGSSGDDNVVWGSNCAGADCDNVVWGSNVDLDNIVWGSSVDLDNIVWGSSDDLDNIVWGSTAESDNVVWGSSATDTFVWGNSAGSMPSSPDEPDFRMADPVAWPTLFLPPNLSPPNEVPIAPVSEPSSSTQQPAASEPAVTVGGGL